MRVALAWLAACALPDEKLLATGNDFSCLGEVAPPGADATVTLSGAVVDPTSSMPIGNVNIDGYLNGVTSPLFTIASNPDGSFSRAQPTGGSPLDIFLHLTAPNFVDGLFYPAAPIAHDLTEQLQLFTPSDLLNIGGFAHVTLDTSQAQLLVVVEDCNGAAVPGATITTSPAGTPLYFQMGRPVAGLSATDSMTGGALIANVPPGSITVGATVGNMTLHAHVVDATANAVLETEVKP